MKDFTENRSIDLALSIYRQRIEDAKIIWEKFGDKLVHRNCPVCDGDDPSEVEKFIGLFPISKCNICQTLYSNPCPNFEAISYYYNKCKCNIILHDLFLKRSEGNNDFVNDYRIERIVDLIKERSTSGKMLNLLEIGCGTGAFLQKLETRISGEDLDFDYTLNGIDIDQNALDLCKNDKIKLMNDNAEDFNHVIKYDFIIHFELIEHLIDPKRFIQNIHRNLSDGGYVIFTTPNSLGLETKAIGYNKTRLLAHSIFPPMHLNAFNTRNIYYFLIKHGFKIDTVSTPGCLDVSILLHTIDEVDEAVKNIANLSSEAQRAIQNITTYLDGSSHMFCIGQKL